MICAKTISNSLGVVVPEQRAEIVTTKQLTDLLIQEFDRRSANKVEVFLAAILRATGLGKHTAEEVAFDMAHKVIRELRDRSPEDLPFRFAKRDPFWLVGKGRIGQADNPLTIATKRASGLWNELLDYLLMVDDYDFQFVCAGAMMLAEAEEMRVSPKGDEGGIDFYGRLMLRRPSNEVETGLMHTTILPRRLLVLGQAKRYKKDVRIGRPEIQQISAQFKDCIEKYEGNPRPPSHRVPESYYHRGEPWLGVCITTASFADTSEGAVSASGIVLVGGCQLSQFLAFHRIGLKGLNEQWSFSADKFEAWIKDQKTASLSSGRCSKDEFRRSAPM